MQNHSKAMIGISNLQRELYILDSTSHHSSFSSITNNSCNAWPLRLGHVSHLGLQAISKIFPCITCNSKLGNYDSCHFAKQKRLPFPDSTHLSSTLFNILHVNL